MKKVISIVIIFNLLSINTMPVFAQKSGGLGNVPLNNFDTGSLIDIELSKNAIQNPMQLIKWIYPPPEPAFWPYDKPKPPDPPVPPGPPQPFTPGPSSIVSSGGGGGAGIAIAGVGSAVPLLVGGFFVAFGLSRRGAGANPLPLISKLDPPITINPDPLAPCFDFEYGEEILYSLVFKNNPKTPIYPDSVIYVKIPAWMQYIPESTTFNSRPLTDKPADDKLTYYSEDSMLILQIGSMKPDQVASVNFGGRILTQKVTKDEAFCLVKFQSISMQYESDWKNLSVDSNEEMSSESAKLNQPTE